MPRIHPGAWMACALLAGVAAGAYAAPPVVRVSGGWIRWLPGNGPLAGYFEIENSGHAPLKLIGASGADFAGIQLHRSITTNGMEHMIHLRAVTIPAGAAVRFKPGGYHLMLWRQKALKIGQKVDIHLRFSDGRDVRASFRVKAPTG